MSPEQGSEEAFREEAERLYALNPSWHIQEAETKISSLQPSAAKLSLRKRTGKHIRDERRLALMPCLRPSRAAGYRRVGIKAENRAYCTGQRGKRKIISKDQTVVGESHCIESVLKYHLSIHGNQLVFSDPLSPNLVLVGKASRSLRMCSLLEFLSNQLC